jgi:DNA-binding NtrC family response regulator
MKRVLVVDDDDAVLSLTGRWLTARGYDVVTANDFTEARAEIQLCRPQIVVIDVRLGQFNGIQLGMLAQEVRSEVQLVIISGWDDPVLRRDAEHLGAVYVQKPFRAVDLIAAIEGANATTSGPDQTPPRDLI